GKAAAIIAAEVWHLANREQMLPRFTKETMPLPGPCVCFETMLTVDAHDSRSATIVECGVKGTSALSCEIHDIPDRTQLVNATFLNIWSQPWMPGIRVADRTLAIASENRYCRILVSFFVFAAEIVLKCA